MKENSTNRLDAVRFANRHGWWIVFLLAALLYGEMLFHEFVWDDEFFVLGRPEIRDTGNLTDFFREGTRGLYRPLREVFYTILWQLSGTNPIGWHLVGPVLHGLISLLFFLVIRSMAGTRVAIFAALLFAAHPVHTERAAHATGSMDLWAIAFMMASWSSANRGGFLQKDKRSILWLSFSLLLFIAALLCGEEAVLLPVYLLLWTIAHRPQKHVFKTLRLEAVFLAIMAFVTAIYLVIRTSAIGQVGRFGGYAVENFQTTFLTMGQVYLRYLRLLFFPTGLRVEYQLAPVSTPADPLFLLGYAAVFGLVTIGIVLLLKRRLTGAAICWGLVALLPFTNLLPSPELIAERYLYVPSMGFCLAIGLFFSRHLRKDSALPAFGKIAITACFGIVLVLFSLGTFYRVQDYKNDCTLFSDAISKTPHSSFAHNNLAFCLHDRGEVNIAEAHFRIAIELNPSNLRARTNLARIYLERDDWESAYTQLLAACSDARAPAKTRALLGMTSEKLKKQEAFKQFATDGAFLYGRGIQAQQAGQHQQAVKLFQQALETDSIDGQYRTKIEKRLKAVSQMLTQQPPD